MTVYSRSTSERHIRAENLVLSEIRGNECTGDLSAEQNEHRQRHHAILRNPTHPTTTPRTPRGDEGARGAGTPGPAGGRTESIDHALQLQDCIWAGGAPRAGGGRRARARRVVAHRPASSTRVVLAPAAMGARAATLAPLP